jgi:MFS family permease
VVSALLIFLIIKKNQKFPSLKDLSMEIVDVIRKSVFQEFKEGMVYFFTKKDIRFAAGIIFILWAALGAVYVVIIVFVQKTLHSVTKDLGLLAMFLGLGLFLGSVVYGRWGRRFSHYKTIYASLVFSGIMLVIFTLGVSRYPSFWIAAGLALLLGVLVSPIMIASNTLIHKVSENAMMGKIFSSLEIVMHFGFVLFMFISSMLAKVVPEATILISVGYLVIGIGLINLIHHRKIPWFA